MSGCAFSISSKSTTENGLRRTFSVSWPPSSKPTKPGSAEQARDGVLLAVLRHVERDHRRLVVEEELGERLGELGLSDARGAAKMNEPEGRFGSLRPARVRRIVFERAAIASWPMTRSCSAFSMKTSGSAPPR